MKLVNPNTPDPPEPVKNLFRYDLQNLSREDATFIQGVLDLFVDPDQEDQLNALRKGLAIIGYDQETGTALIMPDILTNLGHAEGN